MAIEPKRQQLLDKNPKAKTKTKAKRPVVSQQQKPPQKLSQQSRSDSIKKKGGIWPKLIKSFFVLLFIGLIIMPKPQLLSYKKLDLVASSIYIPGWFGQPGFLLDSTQRVIIDEPIGLVYLCFQIEQPTETCNRFQFIEHKGVIAALIHYKQNNF